MDRATRPIRASLPIRYRPTAMARERQAQQLRRIHPADSEPQPHLIRRCEPMGLGAVEPNQRPQHTRGAPRPHCRARSRRLTRGNRHVRRISHPSYAQVTPSTPPGAPPTRRLRRRGLTWLKGAQREHITSEDPVDVCRNESRRCDAHALAPHGRRRRARDRRGSQRRCPCTDT